MSFAVHKLAKFSSNTGKVHFEGLVNLLRYIRDNKTSVLEYYVVMKDAPLSGLLRQPNIKTENQLVVLSDSSWQDCPDTGKNTGAYIIITKVGQLTMSHMFQDQFINQVHTVSTMQHIIQEWI